MGIVRMLVALVVATFIGGCRQAPPDPMGGAIVAGAEYRLFEALSSGVIRAKSGVRLETAEHSGCQSTLRLTHGTDGPTQQVICGCPVDSGTLGNWSGECHIVYSDTVIPQAHCVGVDPFEIPECVSDTADRYGDLFTASCYFHVPPPEPETLPEAAHPPQIP